MGLQRRMQVFLLVGFIFLNSCAFLPPVGQTRKPQLNTSSQGFRTQNLTESGPEPIIQVETLPAQPSHSLKFTSTGLNGSLKIPEAGAFDVEITAGEAFAVVQADATQGPAKITVPTGVFDLYIQAQNPCPDLSPLQPAPAPSEILADLDAVIAAKAQTLISSGQSQCVYLPSQRQNANCNSNAQGLQCSGSLNQTLPASQCPEMAVLAGNVNLNQALSSTLWLSASKQINLNAGAKGLLVSHGHLNTNLQSQATLEGVVVSQKANNFNLQGHFKGLFTSFASQKFPLNQPAQSSFAGALCTPAQLNGNPQGQRIDNPNLILPWVEYLPQIQALTCATRPSFYTSQVPLNCAAEPGNLKLMDNLYGSSTDLSTASALWARLPQRPLPLPASWDSGSSYVLHFENQGARQAELHWFASESEPALPVSVQVIPQLKCIQPNRNGTFTAYLGYQNQMSGPVSIPAGSANFFDPAPAQRGQPTHFAAGFQESAHSVIFTESLSWEINRRRLSLSASDEHLHCPASEIEPTNPHTPVRRTFLPHQTLTLTQENQSFSLPFDLTEATDLSRRIAVNLVNGSSRVSGLKLLLNGQAVVHQRPEVDFLNAEVADMVAELTGPQVAGNQLELQVTGPVGAQVSLSIEGFMRTAYIPNAFHSAIDYSEGIREAPIYPGVVGIKFMEGLKVRLHPDGEPYERLHDLTGFSLAPLRALMAWYEISDITNPIPGTPAEKDALEQQAQSTSGYEAPNMNLFYQLHFAEDQDVWELIDQLNRMPFIEEAYPQFVLAAAQTPATPAPAYFVPAEVFPGPGLTGFSSAAPIAIRHDQWLRSTRIMNQNAGLASPLPLPKPSELPHEGAWDITQGAPNIKVGALEHGYQMDHEDLGNIQQLKNMNPPSGYNDFVHATQTLGTLGATHNVSGPDLGRGSVGVAHGASIWHIFALDNQFSTPSLCKGTGKSKCHGIIDSFEWAKIQGMKIVSTPSQGGAFTPGTNEHWDPALRVHIQQHMSDMVVILPAGNRACEDLQASEFNECKQLFPQGKNIKDIKITEPVYAWDDPPPCETPNPIVFSYPFGPLIYQTQNLGYLFCSKDNADAFKFKYYRVTHESKMPDTGSILVGGLKVDGSAMIPPNASGSSSLPMNYGKSIPSADGLGTSGGHGTDISGPAEHIRTPIYSATNSNSYGSFGGTSGATPVITGVVALMLSVNPALKPRDIRKILRDTEQPLLFGEDISGMVNGHAAVCEAARRAGSNPAACEPTGIKSFKVASVSPANAPPDVLFVTENGPPPVVRPGDRLGVPIEGHDLQTLHLQIGGQNANRLELAVNYGIFEVPQLAAGRHELVITLEDESLTLPEAIEVPVKRVSISMDKPYSMGNLNQFPTGNDPAVDPVRVAFTILDENGEPVNGVYHFTRLNGGNLGMVAAMRSISPVPTTWSNLPSRHFQVQDGQLVIEYQAQYVSAPSDCSAGPCRRRSVRLQVAACSGCAVLFPQPEDLDTEEGRIYSTWLQSADTPDPIDVVANGGDYPMAINNVRDSAGRLVPNGIGVSVEHPFWGAVNLGSSTTVKTGGTIPFIYTAHTSSFCWPNGDNTISRIGFSIGGSMVRAEVRYLRGCP